MSSFELVEQRGLNRICRAECFLHHPGTMPRIPGLYLLNQRGPYSNCQRRVPCAPSFLYFPRPRCIAAVWKFINIGKFWTTVTLAKISEILKLKLQNAKMFDEI